MNAMMMEKENFVKVVLLTPFERFSDKKNSKREIEIRFKKGETFGDLVEKLAKKFGREFEQTLFDKTGQIDDDVMVMLDGRNISAKKGSGFSEELVCGKEYVFCSVISGG
ncbi:MAG: hypothetical protein KKF44_00525 [Nanoarchaeota archaeon]|nr:hypothetical protein [Nanoarchaeota archaeon]